MVIYCCVLGCTNRTDREKHLAFYRLPKVITNRGEERQQLSEERRSLWIEKLNPHVRGRNVDNIRICSAHFLSGKKSDLYPKNDPDWVPSVRMSETGTLRYNRYWNITQEIPNNAAAAGTLIKEMMTQQSQEAKQTDREPEEKLEIKALFQTKRIPANVLCGESSDGLKLQDHLHIKKEEEELWESVEEKQETDITAVTVKSEDEEEEAQCSLLHWRQSEENIKGEPATCSSAKLMKVEPNGDISEGPEAANTCTQQDTDGEETDCSDTEDSEDWREPLSQSEAQSEHMDMSCDGNYTSDNDNRATPHKREKHYGCDVCGKRFSRQSNLKRHTRIHMSSDRKPHGCDVCGKRFCSRIDLMVHTRIHSGERPYGCDLCGKRFTQRGHHSRHMRGHTGEKHFGCDVCGKRFASKAHLKSHTRIHTREKPFTCDVCGKRFSHNESLRRHNMIVHSGEKPFGCDVCGKQIWSKTRLKSHMLIHSGEKVYGCDVCQKKNLTKHEVINHMRIHTEGKPFGCDFCEKRFSIQSNLKRHISIHMNCDSFHTSDNNTHKPHGCDVCGKQFCSRTDLMVHTRIHSGEKPYGCDLCGKQFTQRGNHTRHMRSHTGEKPFGCDMCGKRFVNKAHLKSHMTIHTRETF